MSIPSCEGRPCMASFYDGVPGKIDPISGGARCPVRSIVEPNITRERKTDRGVGERDREKHRGGRQRDRDRDRESRCISIVNADIFRKACD